MMIVSVAIPRPGRGVKTLRLKNQKKGPGGGGFSEGSRSTPQKESKTSLLDTLRVKNHLFLDFEESF